MKKIILILLSVLIGIAFTEAKPLIEIQRTYDFPYQEERADSMKDILEKSNMGEITDAYVGVDVKNNQHPISYYVSKVINYFLGILAFISVLVLIYGFSLVFTDKTDEGVKKGYKYIKMAAIAIIVIGISWLFASWVFYIYNKEVVS